MSGVRAQTWAFRGVLVALNVVGLIWIHHSLTWTPKPRLRVLSALPARDVDTTDRFSLVFDEPLKLAGAVNAVLADSPFVVEPAVSGEWVWAAPERVEYRLSKPLPPGRRFKLRPSPHLERLTGRTLVGQSEFTFETKPLRLVACHLVSSDRSHVNAELCFNQPVDPGELLRHLKVMDAAKRGRKLETQCLTQAPADRLTIRAARPVSNGVRIEVDGKLTGQGGELALGSKVTNDLEVEPAFALLRARAETPRLDRNSSVRLEFSRELKAGQAAPTVQLAPAVEGLSVDVRDNELLVHGPFEPGKRYTVTVGGGLLSAEGKPLGEDATLAFQPEDREPSVSIPLSNGILSPGGNLMLDVQAVNVAGLNIRAARVHENNLVNHLHHSDRKMIARELPEKKVSLQLERNQVGKLALDLREMVGGRRGIYLIEAEATDVTWTSDQAVVAVTDLAITSKAERDGLYIWVTSLRTARPVEGAQVTAISYNGQTLGTGTTDALGLARVAAPTGHPDGRPWVVTARHEEDVSFLKLDERTLIAEGVDYSGREIPKTYDVMVCAERGVYRPGDTIHLTGIVRDGLGMVPPAFPLAMRVYRPDGREVANLPASPEPVRQGMFQVDYPTREDGQVGSYRYAVTLPGDEGVLGSGEVLVEEFVPVRLEVKAEATKPIFGQGESVDANVRARYLFGQPAAELTVTATGTLKRVAFQSKRHEGFTFEDPQAAKAHPLEDVEDTLDENGEASLELLNPEGLPAGLWQGEWAVTVNEDGGRSVSAHLDCQVDTAGRHVGVRLPAGRVVHVGSPVTVEWVQVTSEDKPAEPKTLAFTLQRVEKDVSLEEVSGRLVWKTAERLSIAKEGEIGGSLLTGAQGRFEVLCPAAGEYRLRVADCESGAAAQVDFHASDEAEAAWMLATGTPERLDLVLDQEKYVPGSTAKLLVKSPFPGTLLLTMETDRVIDQRVLDITGESLELEWPVDGQIRGGAFVSATVVRAVDPTRDRWLPHRAYGAARLMTDHRQQALPVAIAAPAKARPGESVSVKVQTASPRDAKRPPMVHLWAVDEGILMTTAYETPEPLEHFFAHRKAGVTTTDIFDELLPDYTRPASMTRIGGDGDELASRARRSPVPGVRRKAAVVWSAAMPVEPDGSIVATMKMPELNGEMRLMAVAVDGDLYGSAGQAITLASPLLVELSAPRFAAPNDRFEMPAKVFNGTDAPVRVSLDVQASGPLEVRAKEPVGQIEVRPGEPVTVWLEAKATGGLGQAGVLVKATGGESLTGTADALFPIRPTGPLHSETELLRIKAGESLRLESPSQFLPGTTQHTVSISARPTVHLQAALEDLIEYPYGCVEQTTSQLWALLHVPELLTKNPSLALGASNADPSLALRAGDEGAAVRAKAVAGMIEAGLARLWSMQTSSGGLAYWPGDSSPTLWGSAYAAEFVVAAQRAGHKPDPRFVEELSKYLQASLGGGGENGEPDDNVRAQLCYVLSVMGKPPQGWMARLSERAGALDMAGRAHLAGAWLAAGRKDRAAAVLPEDSLAGKVATTTGGRLTSQVRSEAVLLNVLIDLDARHPWIPALVERLEKARKAGRWGSTLENASALAAMARYQTLGSAAAKFEGTVAVGDVRRAFTNTAGTVFQVADEGKPIEIQSTGEGDIYVSITTEGLLREGKPQDYDRGLQVARKWTDRNGEPVDPAKLRVGDLVWVETTLTAPGASEGEPVENVAVVDALPAGLEVENPRLATSQREDDRQSAEPDRVEFRDDRVLLFASAGAEKQTFRYALRVVTVGTFAWPAIQASCMYDAGFAAIHDGGQKVVVEVRSEK